MLKLTRWIKGESSEVSRLRADTYDELKELDIVEYTESYWKNLPIGFEYVQRKGQAAPSTLFGGGTWSNVSSEYAGLFERIEGGNAAAYGSTQPDAMQGHYHLGGYNTGGNYGTNGWGTYTGSKVNVIGGANSGVTYPGLVGPARTDGTNGDPRTAGETRPANTTVRVWRLAAY